MKQYFLLGASSVYGVGGENGGWAELLKQYIHHQLYGKGGSGEAAEVFNFGKSGATVEFVLDTFPEQIKHYGRSGEIVSIVMIGGNNSKAIDAPNNYVSTVEEYIAQMTTLLALLKQHSAQVVVASNGYVDESKTNPKISPFTGRKSYFTNARRAEFHAALKKLCEQMNVSYANVDIDQQTWQQKYLYEDGLHPNNEGHELLFQSVRKALSI
jgi:lysophospholipase L1-like esterase